MNRRRLSSIAAKQDALQAMYVQRAENRKQKPNTEHLIRHQRQAFHSTPSELRKSHRHWFPVHSSLIYRNVYYPSRKVVCCKTHQVINHTSATYRSFALKNTPQLPLSRLLHYCFPKPRNSHQSLPTARAMQHQALACLSFASNLQR